MLTVNINVAFVFFLFEEIILDSLFMLVVIGFASRLKYYTCC